jgi:beta-N-acetylhexosaminidase
MYHDISFKNSIGQRLIISLQGNYLNQQSIDAIQNFRVPNFLLQGSNIENKEQLTTLCSTIKQKVDEILHTPSMIFLLSDEITDQATNSWMISPPAPLALQATGDESNCYTAAFIHAKELKSIGIDAIIAPSLNINTNKRNRELGLLSFSDSPETVARFASSMAQGYIDGGIFPVCHSFPGSGELYRDDKEQVDQNDKCLEELSECELYPFVRLIENGTPGIMCAPAYYSAFDETHMISSMSDSLINHYLRETLGYTSLVFSPVIDLPTISNFFPIEQVGVESLKAGCDFLFLSDRYDHLEKIFSSVKEAFETSYLSWEDHENSIERIFTIRASFEQEHEDNREVNEEEMIVSAMIERSITIVQNSADTEFSLGNFPIFLSKKSTSISFAKWMQEAIGGEFFEFSDEIDSNEMNQLLEEVSDNTSIVIGIKDGHLFNSQLTMANALGSTGIPTIAISLHNPYDLLFLNPSIYSLAAFEASPRAFEAIRKVLEQERNATGTLSIHW